MKKYLINGALALIVGACIASCSKDDIYKTQTSEQKKASFDELFTSLYGDIDPDQNWGFNPIYAPEDIDLSSEDPMEGSAQTRALTRQADPGDGGEWFGPSQGATYAALGLVAPEMVSKEEEDFVANWFRTNQYPQSDPINLSNFFVQQVYFGTKEYTGYDGNGAEHKVIGGQHMDWLCAGSAQIGDDHMYNFNTSAPERYWTANGTYDVRTYMSKMQLMLNSSTARFGFKESQGTDNTVYHNFVIKALKFNGKWGYYVGFDYENHGQNGDFSRDFFYDDRIIKIVPGNGVITWTPETPSYNESTSVQRWTHREIKDQGRVFCEDLASADMGPEDIDYNDVVFDARVWFEYDYYITTYNNNTTSLSPAFNYRYTYDISLLAAGGTIELKVNDQDVHNKFGVGMTFMVNTWTENSKAFGQYNTRPMNAVDLPSYSINLTEQNKNNNFGISSIPIEVRWDGNNMMAIDTKNGTAPYKLCVPLGTLWPIERANIQTAYTGFNSYVNSAENKFYEGTKVSEYLYTMAPQSSIQTDGKNIGHVDYVQVGNPTTSQMIVVWSGEVTPTYASPANLTLYTHEFKSGETLRFFATKTGDNPTITVVAGASTSILNGSSIEKGYADVTINASQAAELSKGITVSGQNIKLTKIGIPKN